jgi:hypothetical protein
MVSGAMLVSDFEFEFFGLFRISIFGFRIFTRGSH